jgi:hypothetical protein
MATLETLNEINDFVREYLRYHNMTGTLEALESEVKTKQMARRLRNDPSLYGSVLEPRIHALFRPVTSPDRKALQD